MSTPNAKSPTPTEAFNILVQLSKLPELKLNLQDHAAIQVALETLKPLVVNHDARPPLELLTPATGDATV